MMKLFGVERLQSKKESLGTSGLPQLARTQAAKKAVESAKTYFIRFRESAETAQTGNKFRVILIQEGLGNMGDCFYYTKQALQGAVASKLFEGKKCFANHPDSVQEQIRPERDVNDIIGHFENVTYESQSDGRGILTADLCVLPGPQFDKPRTMIRESIKFAAKHQGQDLIGFSINANGDAEEAKLADFIQQATIPESAKPKLLEALKNGVEIVRPVTTLSSAVSVDLVTEAGAGGRALQLLEQEKKMGLKSKEKKKEADESKEKAKEDGAMEGKDEKEAPAKEGEEASDEGHDDADQDKKLIKEMLDKYVGGDKEHSEESCKLAKEAYEAAKSPADKGGMGLDHEEAMDTAGKAMKMAHHMASKAEAAKEAEEKKEGEDKKKPEGIDQGAGAESKKESTKVLQLTAEVARLKESLKKVELEKFLDKTLRESKLPMSATKKLRECIGTAKSEKEVTEKVSVFTEAYKLGGEAEGFSFVIAPEKTEVNTTSGGFSFAECIEKI